MKKTLFIVALSLVEMSTAWSSNVETNVLKNDTEPVSKKETKLNVSKSTGCTIRYHYFPNMQAYYDLKEKVYYFQENGQWYTSDILPTNYGGYSIFKNEKVQITDYDGDNPETMIKIHSKKFPYNSKGRIKRPAENMIGNDLETEQIAIN